MNAVLFKLTGWDEEADRFLVTRRKGGAYHHQIAAELGCSTKRIQRRLHRLGMGEPCGGNPNWRKR
jgi:hypothetical protein